MVPSGVALYLAVLAVWIGTGTAVWENQASKYANDKAMVLTVYYEALDNASLNFFREQLLPTYMVINTRSKNDSFYPYLRVHLTPYGRSTPKSALENPDLDFLCENGKSECTLNTLMVCGNYLYMADKIYFSTCVMQHGMAVLKKLELCAHPLGLDRTELQKCTEPSAKVTKYKGKSLMKVMAKYTPSYIFSEPLPMIITDDYYEPRWQRYMKTNLFQFVCSYLKNEPPACKKSKSINTVAGQWMKKQLNSTADADRPVFGFDIE